MTDYPPQLKAIFDQAVELPSDTHRSSFLDEACSNKPELRREIERLLHAFQLAGSFLESPPDQLSPNAEDEAVSKSDLGHASRDDRNEKAQVRLVDQHEATSEHAIHERPGAEVGPYKLLQQIGEGGFGVVFMAEQQKPLRRKVALKIIKAGMDTKDVIARFEAERQALALMDHPNIAKVLDAGTTSHGRPYFVMELVRGVPITEFCDANNLATRDRLELFVMVCRAVQHAHTKGIIHRDIKPSNVMVTLHDNRPLPKIIDFGVSKAISQQLTEKTLFTAYGQMVGTPQYMSPEQAQMSALDIDTRSDIYALGVLLYELLTGSTPLTAERLRGSAYAQMQRMIQEELPQKPSVRLSTLGDASATIAKHYGTDSKRLGQFIRGDLDWIVMKALEKDRSDRYDTAISFGADVERFLRDEPTEARPPSTTSRLRRALRRNKGPVVAATLIFASLLTGLLLTFSAWRETESARQTVVATAERYQATLQRLQDVLVEQALLAAVGGELDAAQRAIDDARVAGVSPVRLDVLRGTASLFAGEEEKAIVALAEAVEQDPRNATAWALLEQAYDYVGDMDGQAKSRRELATLKPTDDFDRVFMSHAQVRIQPQAALRQIEDVVDRRPTWFLARAMLADMQSFLAVRLQDPELAQAALVNARSVRAVLPKNAFVLTVALHAHTVSLKLLRQDLQSLAVEAEAIAIELGKQFPNYSFGRKTRALYFSVMDRFDEAEAEWNVAVQLGGDEVKNQYVAFLIRQQKYERALAVGCFTHAVAAFRGDRTATLSHARSLSPNASLVDRFWSYYALALCGELQEANAGWKRIRQSEAVIPPWVDWPLRLFTEEATPEQILAETVEVYKAHGHLVVGTYYLVHGKRKLAQEHFRLAVQANSFTQDTHQWALTYHQRLERDPEWPRWIRESHDASP